MKGLSCETFPVTQKDIRASSVPGDTQSQLISPELSHTLCFECLFEDPKSALC